MRRLSLAVLGSVLAVALVGCGGDEEAREAQIGQGRSSPSAAVPDGVAAQYRTIEQEVRAEGGETEVGAWRVAYIVEPAEPWFEPRGGSLVWRPVAPAETHHIEILPFEAETGRLVPDVPVELEIHDERGEVVDAKRLSLYYAEFFHYANNFSVPEAGRYTLRARIHAPTFRRHGERTNEPPLAEGVTATFPNVRLEPEK
jgi:hypothetical protein